MLCPNCDLELKMSERQGVEIDYCPRCRGIWLDRGELDKIIDRSTSNSKPSSKYEERKYKDHKEYKHKKKYYKKKKRGSFLEDLFDF